MRYVFLAPDEEQALRDLEAAGSVVTAQDVPSARPIPLAEVLAGGILDRAVGATRPASVSEELLAAGHVIRIAGKAPLLGEPICRIGLRGEDIAGTCFLIRHATCVFVTSPRPSTRIATSSGVM